MTVKVYQNLSERNHVQKNLDYKTDIECILKEETDVVNPVLLITAPSWANNWNYIYIPDLLRYYFVVNVEYTKLGLYTIYLHVDVLQSFWFTYKNVPCIISRNQNLRTNDLIDAELLATKDRLISVQQSSLTPFRTVLGVNYVLTLTGLGTYTPVPPEPEPEA